MRKLLKLIFNRWTLMVFGLIAISVLIWWVAPAIQIFGHAPLAPEWVRWTLIALVCGLVVGKALWKLIRARRAGAALAAGLAQPAAGAPAQPGDEEGTVLADRFHSAMEVLKKTSLGKAKRSPLARLDGVLNGRYLYELPWYMFIGAPGSGKTTALRQFGPQVPARRSVGEGAIRGVGGTRNCDWWFTDEAVLIDTAGRYTTQDSEQNGRRGGLARLPRPAEEASRRAARSTACSHRQRLRPAAAASRERDAHARRGAPAPAGAARAARRPLPGLRAGHQVRPARRLHRVLRHVRQGGARRRSGA